MVVDRLAKRVSPGRTFTSIQGNHRYGIASTSMFCQLIGGGAGGVINCAPASRQPKTSSMAPTIDNKHFVIAVLLLLSPSNEAAGPRLVQLLALARAGAAFVPVSKVPS